MKFIDNSHCQEEDKDLKTERYFEFKALAQGETWPIGENYSSADQDDEIFPIFSVMANGPDKV
jgi:hypothetical protein